MNAQNTVTISATTTGHSRRANCTDIATKQAVIRATSSSVTVSDSPRRTTSSATAAIAHTGRFHALRWPAKSRAVALTCGVPASRAAFQSVASGSLRRR